MSTRCEIGLVEADGSVKVIYNHFDGYLDGVGRDMVYDWNSEELAREVVIDKKYNQEEELYTFSNVEDWLNHLEGLDREYAYLWRNGQWEYTYCNNWRWENKWFNVKEELDKEK